MMVLAVLVGAGAIAVFLGRGEGLNKTIEGEAIDELRTIKSQIDPSLYTMTIPYLRERDYASSLGEMEKLREAGDYSVYLTNYDSDGFRVNGLLAVPKGEMPAEGWPAVVFIHGYQNPATYQTDGQSYAAYWSYLARAGFVVFKIDLRGHGESEGARTSSYFSGEAVVDALNAYAALRGDGGGVGGGIRVGEGEDFVNSARVYMWGHSMAGNTILRAVAARPEVIPKVAIWGGAVFTYTDMGKYGIHDTSYVRQPVAGEAEGENRGREVARRLRPSLETIGNENDVFWQATIPTNYLNEIKTEIGLFHAINDEVVNVGYSRDLEALAATSSATVVLHEYATGGHNISSPAFEEAMRETVEFFRE